MNAEYVCRVVLIGVGATAVMDAWLQVLKMCGVPTLNFALLGRWIGNMRKRKWFHASMLQAEPIRRELLIGWLAHYAIGICFAGLLVALTGVAWIENPAFGPALMLGVATVAAPLLVMQPAMGAGIAASKTASPVSNCFKSIVGHAVFGCGLYLAARALVFWF